MNARQRSLIVILLCLASIQTATAKRLRFIRGCEITKLTEDAGTCRLSPSANLWITIRPEIRDLPNEPNGQISYSETDFAEKEARAKYGANVLRLGEIPPKAFIEGIIFLNRLRMTTDASSSW